MEEEMFSQALETMPDKEKQGGDVKMTPKI